MICSNLNFETLTYNCKDRLLRTAFRLVGDKHHAEDVVQETLRSAWKSFHSFDHQKNYQTWLFSILRRRVADHWRKRKEKEELTSSVKTEFFSEDPFRDEIPTKIKLALDKLPKEIRETFMHIALGGLTHSETAAKQGIPIGTVLSRFSRARTRLHKELSSSC